MSTSEQVSYSFALLMLTFFVQHATSMAPFLGLNLFELMPEAWLQFAILIPAFFFAMAMSAMLTIHVCHKQGISSTFASMFVRSSRNFVVLPDISRLRP